MKSLIILSFKKIIRTNQIILLIFILAYISLLYFGLHTREFKSIIKNLNLIISYVCLLLTGGHLKDEISNGYLDIILHRTGRVKIVLAKFLSVFFFSFVLYLFLLFIITIFALLYGNIEELKPLFILSLKGFIITIYLISIGLFLSLYLKGYFNFALVIFLEFAFLAFMDIFGVFDQLEITGKISNLDLFFISLLSPHMIYSMANVFSNIVIIVFSIIFIVLTMCLFKKIDVKRG